MRARGNKLERVASSRKTLKRGNKASDKERLGQMKAERGRKEREKIAFRRARSRKKQLSGKEERKILKHTEKRGKIDYPLKNRER